MPDFILRPAVETDAPRIRDLIHRVGINPMDLKWIHFVVAESADGQFMGCAQLKMHRDGSVELASLAVEEGYRQQGLARALIEHFLADSPRPLFLMCRPGLVPFYEKFGFRVIGLEAMPPYFRRICRLVKAMGFLMGGEEGPAVMRLD
jgi:N-acetylglutamate synthase-like GNAT family acetyltransferase